jgi:hypothetical protein
MNNKSILKSIIGLNIDEATKILREAGYKYVIVNAGVPQLLTSSICRDRITIEVIDGKVVDTSIG